MSMGPEQPMNSIEHQHLRESLALLALDRLEDGERSTLGLHVLVCPECQEELDDFRAVAALLRPHSLTGRPFS
jgi:anti-sigma factor ChrR (cupin superfamily)